MPPTGLATAKGKLQLAIEKAFQAAFDTANNSKDQNMSSKIRKDLATDLCNAIDDYVKSAQVNIGTIVSTVPPGVTIAGAGGGPAPVTGATIAPGVAQHAGFGSLQ